MQKDRLTSSRDIDLFSAVEIVRVIQYEDRRLTDELQEESRRIAHAVDEIVARLRDGGRLFYAGAGRSARIAMLDASTLPQTFGIPQSTIQIIAAGGAESFAQPDDDPGQDEHAAITEVNGRVRPHDAVVAISASGETPFTIAAVRRANMHGSLTVGICTTPGATLTREVDIPIVPSTEPEVILGPRDHKGLVARMMVLSTLSTAVMIRLNRVHSNLAVDMAIRGNGDRVLANRMVEYAAGVDSPVATTALERSGGDIRAAILIASRDIPLEEARRLLDENQKRLRGLIPD